MSFPQNLDTRERSATPELSSGGLEEETPTPSPGPTTSANKFSWLKRANANNVPFSRPRPSLTRESSTAELVSRENSSADFFQNSRLNLFETAPKPDVLNNGKKVIGDACLQHVLTCSMQPTADPRICLSTTNLYPND
ncbi:hypothetical protein EVAR_14403_1 [Eumeta japonica]|uniref:Uncharacterized protein n=1 Tax=Eumeta variegata TaxID=151549 RepID=A0A4C1TX46_EUMVA|nr:hypothetical protein EVAR_14403_1 [Eumeta japonica]